LLGLKCYLQAWTNAARFAEAPFSTASKSADQDADGGALRNEFIPNWSGPEFVAFVDLAENLLDEIAEAGQENGLGEVDMNRAKDLWRRVLDVEVDFWPRME
jgi:thiaminase